MTSKRTLTRVISPLVLSVLATLVLHVPVLAQQADDVPHSAAAREVFVPVLDTMGDDGSLCPVEIVIQNVGSQASKGVIVFWEAPDTSAEGDPGPMHVECTGLLAPGTAWRVAGPAIPEDARSAAIYSATAQSLSEIGVEIVDDYVVADFLCETLFFTVAGDGDNSRRFMHAVREGGEFSVLPMDRALGGPLSVLVNRSCADGSLGYAGVSSDAALAAPSDESEGYEYSLPVIGASSGRSGFPLITAMNVGLGRAAVAVFAAPNLMRTSPEDGTECPQRASCGTFSMAPGEAVSFDPVEAGCLDGDGTAWLESDQPLVVIVDDFGPAGRTSTAALRMNAQGPGDGSDSGGAAPLADHGIDRLSAPLVYHGYRGWATVIHIANASSEEVSVRLAITNRAGNAVSTRDFSVCPHGGRSVTLGVDLPAVPSNFVGSLSIKAVDASGGVVRSDDLAATVELIRSVESGEPASAAAYEVLPAASGDALIGVPKLVKDSDRTSTLAIQNRVTAPGFTDYVMHLFDSSGLVDYVCLKLYQGEVEYIDLSTWVYLGPMFVGSAVISAVYWEHSLVDDEGQPVRDLVSLGAVLMEAQQGSPGTVPPVANLDGPVTAIMLPPVEVGSSAAIPDLSICGRYAPPLRGGARQLYLPMMLRVW